MRVRRLIFSVAVVLASQVHAAIAAEPLLLRYRFAKGDQIVYRTKHEEQQSQTVGGEKHKSTVRDEVVTSQFVDEIDGEGNAIIRTKAVHRKRKMGGQGGKLEFDSKSAEHDTGSETGSRITPVLERITNSEYKIKVTPRGELTEVKGFTEIVADLNPAATLEAGVLADDESQKHSEQERFVVFSDKPVSPGDTWEHPFESDLKGIGKFKGKTTYTYEADDKVGDRKTVRIGIKNDLTIEFNLDAGDIKLTGTMTTSSSSGTVQFDPTAGRIVSAKDVIEMTGELNIEIGGMMLPLTTTEEHATRVDLLDKLPE